MRALESTFSVVFSGLPSVLWGLPERGMIPALFLLWLKALGVAAGVLGTK